MKLWIVLLFSSFTALEAILTFSKMNHRTPSASRNPVEGVLVFLRKREPVWLPMAMFILLLDQRYVG